jgi:hypothetical protein
LYNIQIMRLLLFFSVFVAIVFLACGKDNMNPQHPVPYVTVNRQINMDNALYTSLNSPGGYVYLDGEGYKGIIVSRDFADNFYVADRACPFHPDAACAKLIVEKSGISIVCGSYSGSDFSPCCESRFGFDGSIQHGPSEYPLKAYNVTRSGSLLSITNY